MEIVNVDTNDLPPLSSDALQKEEQDGAGASGSGGPPPPSLLPGQVPADSDSESNISGADDQKDTSGGARRVSLTTGAERKAGDRKSSLTNKMMTRVNTLRGLTGFLPRKLSRGNSLKVMVKSSATAAAEEFEASLNTSPNSREVRRASTGSAKRHKSQEFLMQADPNTNRSGTLLVVESKDVMQSPDSGKRQVEEDLAAGLMEPATPVTPGTPSNPVHQRKQRRRLSFIRGHDIDGTRASTKRSLKELERLTKAVPTRICIPDAKIRVYWDLFIVVLVLWNMVILPVDMAFDTRGGPAWLIFDSLCDLCFVVDIAFQFYTPYWLPKSKRYEIDRTRIRLRYLQSWFAIDACSSIPFDLIFYIYAQTTTDGSTSGDAAQNVQFVKTAKIGRLLKNVRILRLGRIFKKIAGGSWAKVFSHFTNFGRIMQLFLSFVVVSHLVGCTFYFICDFDISVHPTTTWLWARGIHSLQTDSFGDKYITSVYSALLLLLGESIDPQTQSEKIFVMIIMLLGAVLYASLFGQMSLLIANFNRTSNRLKQRRSDCEEQLLALGFDDKLYTRVQRYLSFEWETNRCLDRGSFISSLSPALQDEINVVMVGSLIAKVPFFATMETTCLIAMVRELRSRLYLANDYIIHKGRRGREM